MVIGQQALVDRLILSLLCKGHVLLEAMQELQVTLGETTYRLPDPFLVLATQNPIDQEGTYQLQMCIRDRLWPVPSVSICANPDGQCHPRGKPRRRDRKSHV